MNTFPYDAVLFDLDGTLFNAEPGIVGSALHTMRKLERSVPENADLRQIIGPPLRESFETIFGLEPDLTEQAVQIYREHFLSEGMYRYTVYPHIRTVLQMLKEGGVYVALATSKPESSARKILDYFGMTHYFNAVVGVPDHGETLHKPELVRMALPEKYERAAMVGDRCFDMRGAAENGIEGIGAGYGYGTEEELRDAGAAHIVYDTESLRALLCSGAEVPRGFFLTVEGLDGSGKTTQIDLLERGLRDFGYRVLRTREPGGCNISEDIRRIVLGTENMEMCAACEALLYAAARAQHVHQVIRPAVEEGTLVLCDRFVDSSIAYQGGGRELGVDVVQQINAPAVAELLPDATLYLSIDHKRAMERRRSAGALDRLELAGMDFHERAQKAYEKLIHDNKRRFVVVDADQEVDVVAKDALTAVLNRLEPERRWEA